MQALSHEQYHQGRSAGPRAARQPFSELARKVVLLVGEDGFALSHCRGLISVLAELVRQVVVVTRSSGRSSELEALGAGVIDFDCRSSWSNPARAARTAWRLAQALEAESPDAVHIVGFQPAVLGCLALKLVPATRVIVHLPDLGPLDPATAGSTRLYRAGALRLLASLLRSPASFLLVENADDLAHLIALGADPGPRFAVLGGSGIDTDVYPVLPPAQSDMPVAAFVGHMVRANGVDVLMRAFDRLWARGVHLRLDLFAEGEASGKGAIPSAEVAQWCLHPGVRCEKEATDVREVWRRAEIFVLPALVQQGIPRTLLEAAACGRALIVTDVPGIRNFVRDGVEGLIVPRDDAAALAEALERLARDFEMRARMGQAARLRVLQGFTEAHVKQALRGVYLSLLGGNRP